MRINHGYIKILIFLQLYVLILQSYHGEKYISLKMRMISSTFKMDIYPDDTSNSYSSKSTSQINNAVNEYIESLKI